MLMARELTGRIFNIQRYCAGDGPGIRTTVFFQGCPLHCVWCHNPESHPFSPRVSFQKNACIGCGRCKNFLPGENCRRRPDESCSGCGLCVKECPGAALTLLGRSVSVEDVMRTVRRDRFYYDETGGGLTLSGGEPLAQMEFALSLLSAAKEEGISTAVETSGAVPRRQFECVIGKCDLFLFDIKASRARYQELTGADFELVYRNLCSLSAAGCRIFLRVPMVQGKNADEDFLTLLKELSGLPHVESLELLPYHDMGRGKAEMTGRNEADWDAMSAPPVSQLELWDRILKSRMRWHTP